MVYFWSFLPHFTHRLVVLRQKRFHSRYNCGYGILLYIRKKPYFRPLTAHFGGSRGIFSYINDKSAILCPTKTEVADFVRLRVQSFKGSIVQVLILLDKMEFISFSTCKSDRPYSLDSASNRRINSILSLLALALTNFESSPLPE